MHSIVTRLTAIGLSVPLVLGMAGTALAQDGSNQASCNYPGDLTGGKPLVIVIEGLGDPSSGFFRTLNNGAQQAAKDLCVEARYIYPQGGSFDLASYTQQIEQSIAAKPDGVVILGIGDLDAVAQEAKDAGIAVGFQPAPSAKDMPLRDPNDIYVSRVGADEYAGGAMAANRFIADGAKSLVCVQQDPADGTQTMRCQGMADVATEAGVKYQLVAGSPDPGQTAALLEPFLRANADVDAMLNTGGSATPGLVTAKNAVGREIFTGWLRCPARPRQDDPGRRPDVHHRPAGVLAWLHLRDAARPLPPLWPRAGELLPDRTDPRGRVECGPGRQPGRGRRPLRPDRARTVAASWARKCAPGRPSVRTPANASPVEHLRIPSGLNAP